MKKKTRVLAVSYTAALIVVLGVCLFRTADKLNALRYTERNTRLAAVSQLSDSLARMSDTMAEGQYAVSPALLASLSAEIWNHSAAAVAAMSVLPLSDVSLERTDTFIARTGDYARYIARCAAAHRTLRQEEKDALARLSQTAAELSRSVLTLEDDLYADKIDFVRDEGGMLPGAVQRFSDLEEGFPEWEGVDYDGGMSAHLASRTPRLTAETAEIDAAEAARIAASALGEDAAALAMVGESGGAIPTRQFAAPSGASAAVCRNGGYLLELYAPEPEGEAALTAEEAADAAARFLEELGYRDLVRVWQSRDGDAVSFRFAAETAGVRVYPDAVSVRISLRDGSVLRLNAAAYVTEHSDRVFPEPRISADRAAASLPEMPDVRYTGLALIHSPGMREVLCHEYRCRGTDGRELLIWCDAETGEQQALQILEKTENGAVPTGPAPFFSGWEIDRRGAVC